MINFFQEIIIYLKRQEYELSLLHYISNEFLTIDKKFKKIKKKKHEKEMNNTKAKELKKVKK